MRVIGRAGVGVDNINVPEATKYTLIVISWLENLMIKFGYQAWNTCDEYTRRKHSQHSSADDVVAVQPCTTHSSGQYVCQSGEPKQQNKANVSLKVLFLNMGQGKWDRKSFTGVEIAEKTLGIIGCGRIGQVGHRHHDHCVKICKWEMIIFCGLLLMCVSIDVRMRGVAGGGVVCPRDGDEGDRL